MRLAALGGTPVVDVTTPDCRWPRYDEDDVDTIAAMVRDGTVAYTDREGVVGDFEAAFSELVGTEFALATNSGTSALHSAYFGLGIPAGSEVLVPAYTFLATATPLLALNLVPVFVDVDPRTGNLDAAAVDAAIGPRTRAVAVTHLNGYPGDVAALADVCRRRDVMLVEDASQAHGAEVFGRPVGSWGDVAAFSCQAKKLVPAGTGGVMVTDDEEIYQRAVLLGHFLDRSARDVTMPALAPFADIGFGMNNRIHPLGAALGLNGLVRLSDQLEVRRRNFEILDEGLDGIPGVRPPQRQAHMTKVVHYSYQPLFIPGELEGVSRRTFLRALAAEGVPVSVPTSPPLPDMSGFRQANVPLAPLRALGSRDGTHRCGPFPGAESYFGSALRLPNLPTPAEQYVRRIVDAFVKVSAAADQLRTLEHDCGLVPQ